MAGSDQAAPQPIQAAITGKSIRNPINGYDLTNTAIFYSKYDDPKDRKGLRNLNTFMLEQGASLCALTFPR